MVLRTMILGQERKGRGERRDVSKISTTFQKINDTFEWERRRRRRRKCLLPCQLFVLEHGHPRDKVCQAGCRSIRGQEGSRLRLISINSARFFALNCKPQDIRNLILSVLFHQLQIGLAPQHL